MTDSSHWLTDAIAGHAADMTDPTRTAARFASLQLESDDAQQNQDLASPFIVVAKDEDLADAWTHIDEPGKGDQ